MDNHSDIDVPRCRYSIQESALRANPLLKKPKQSPRTTIFYLLLGLFALNCAWISNLFEKEIPLEVILVIDTSESMAGDNKPGSGKHALEDPANPAFCNLDYSCEPFRHVKAAAAAFAAQVLDKPPEREQDRLAVVTFATGWQSGDLGTKVKLNWTNNILEAMHPLTGIPGLKVYNPGVICPFGEWGCPSGSACPANRDAIPTGACLYYGDPDPLGNYTYQGFHCPRIMDVDVATGEHWDPLPEAVSACTTSNIGGGLRLAGQQFSVEDRPETLQIVILLADGAANATFAVSSDAGMPGIDLFQSPVDPWIIAENLPLGFCPEGTWESWDITGARRIFCQDGDVDTYHEFPDPAYDADDFARDHGKFIACNRNNPAPSCRGIKGRGAILITIGLGKEILALDPIPTSGTGSLTVRRSCAISPLSVTTAMRKRIRAAWNRTTVKAAGITITLRRGAILSGSSI
ncbi:MAG: hypothetical protein WBM17_10190 [Anaerolineales bacterium]